MDLRLLIDKIQRDKGFDFKEYRQSSLIRRIKRRMEFDGAVSIEEYIKLLDTNNCLYHRLINDLFINVTEFFRDEDIWRLLKAEVLPEVIEKKLISDKELEPLTKPGLRIWFCGCASGQEAYSFAICLEEALKDRTADLDIKIFATDANEEVIKIARKGEYKAEAVSKLPDSLLEEYFTPLDNKPHTNPVGMLRGRHLMGQARCKTKVFKIKEQLRDKLIFGTHNLVSDFYIGDIDIIVCRNVFIYFQRELQDRVLTRFYKALVEGGLLWLGTAESLSENTKQLFAPVYGKQRLFKKR